MTKVACDEQLATLAAWCATADAASAASHLLRSRHLPTDADHVDDVLAEVQFRIVRRIRRLGPLDERPDGRPAAVAYARAIMGTVVDDLLRGRRLDTELPDDLDAGVDAAPHTPDAAAGSDTADEVRRQLHVAVHPRDPWIAAAALTVVTLAMEPDHPLQPATPHPGSGGEQLIATWAGLHYAGRDDCFTDQHGPPDSACRNRRLRATQRVDRALADAFRAAIDAELLG